MNIWASSDVLRELLKSILALLKVICSCKSIFKVCCHLAVRDIITETLRDGEREREERGNKISGYIFRKILYIHISFARDKMQDSYTTI